MKHLIIFILLLTGLGASSCKKCYQCTNALGESVGECCGTGSKCDEFINNVTSVGGNCDR